MKYVSMLIIIEKHLIVPCFAFVNFFPLKGYGQYGMRGIVVNVPKN